MSRLARFTQKIFAGSATNNGVFGSAQDGTKVLSNNLATIQGKPAWDAGWLSAIMGASKFPPLEEIQSLTYLQTSQLAYIFQQGIPEYDAGTTYYTNGICMKAGTWQVYGSLTNANIGNPLTDVVNWQFLGDLSLLSNPGNFFVGGVTTGSANAQLIATTSPVSTSFANGQAVTCTAGFTNTGSMTFGAGGETPIIVKKDTPTGLVALVAGDVTLNDTMILVKNTTAACWVLTAGFPLGSAAYKGVSDTSQSLVASLFGSFTIGHLAVFKDTAGTLQDGGVLQVLQQVRAKVSASSTGTTIIPADNTIPQQTEGDQYLSLAITPKSSTSILLIEVLIHGSISTSNSWQIALFRDATANALSAAAIANAFTSGIIEQGALKHYETSGSTAATTFKVRCGPDTAATFRINGDNASGALFGGVMESTIIITEYAA